MIPRSEEEGAGERDGEIEGLEMKPFGNENRLSHEFGNAMLRLQSQWVAQFALFNGCQK